jgi:zinc protease
LKLVSRSQLSFRAGAVIGVCIALACLLTASAVAQAPAPGSAPQARKRPPLSVATLSNGLRLFSRKNDASEITSVVCLVRAGLPEEREEQAGIAALTAEALLKGTTTHPGRTFIQQVVNAGGNIRAIPGYDYTEISVVTGRDQFDDALKLIGDVVTNPRFSPEDVNEAREAIRRRIISFQDDFTGASYQSLTAQLHPQTPYGRPMNGYLQTLGRLTAEDVRAFWKANYVQNRMWVAIVGDVNSDRAMGLAQKAFGGVPAGPRAAPAPPAAQRLARPRVEWIQRSGPAAQVMAGFLAPAATKENYAVHALIDAIVGGGKRARLFTNIREKHDLGYQLGSFYQPLRHQSHLVGYVVTPPLIRRPGEDQPVSPVEEVKDLILQQYRDLAAAGPTDAELVRARAYVVGRYALRQERTRDQAKWLAWNDAMGLGADFDDQFPGRVQAVTREQITAAAKALVEQYALVVTVPES